MTNSLPLSARIYGLLLVFYPDDLRRDYGADMALVFAEDLDAARSEAGLRGAIRVWRRALGEFLRFALPNCTSSSAVRVPAISLVLFASMMSGMLTAGVRHGPTALAFFHAPWVVLLLPLFSTPFVTLASFWACRGSGVVSLGQSIDSSEEQRQCSKSAI